MPITVAEVHSMARRMAREALSEDGHNSQCAVLQSLRVPCGAWAACGAELDVGGAQAQLGAAKVALIGLELDSLSLSEAVPSTLNAKKAVEVAKAKLQRLVLAMENLATEQMPAQSEATEAALESGDAAIATALKRAEQVADE